MTEQEPIEWDIESEIDTQAPLKTVYIVDKDSGVVSLLKMTLAEEGFDTKGTTNIKKGFESIVEELPDFAILEPDVAVRLAVEKKGKRPSIVAIGEKRHSLFVSTILDAGVDQYIEKPILTPVLASSMRAISRRVDMQLEDEVIQVGELIYDVNATTIKLGDKVVKDLTPSELEVFDLLIKNNGGLVTYEVLESKLGLSIQGVRAYISRIKSKLGKEGRDYIKTHKGQGYRIIE